PREQLHEGRLARAVAAEQPVDAVLGEREIRVGDRVHGVGARAIGLGESGYADHGSHRPASSIIAASWAGVMPSLCASVSRGATYCSRNRSRRWATRRVRAPSATNMPRPLFL